MKKFSLILFLFTLTLILIFLHSKGVFLYKNFSIEDGLIFFTQSLKYGLNSLYIPYAGYSHFILRLLALIASLFPLSVIPVIYLFFNIILRFFVVMGVYYMLDLKNVKYGAFIALIPLLAPVEADVYDNIPNLQWFLALLFALLLSSDWSKWNRYLTSIGVLLLALTGPFSILFLPIILFRTFIYKDLRRQRFVYLAYFIGLLIQLYFVLNSGRMSVSEDIAKHISPFLHNFIFCFSSNEFISLIIFFGFLCALYNFVRKHSFQNYFKLLSLLYAGIIIVFSGIVAISQLSETYIPGRYLYVYVVSVLLFIILVFKNKYVTLSILLLLALSFTTVNRRDIYWDQYLKYSKFNDVVFVTTNPGVNFYATIPNKNSVKREADAIFSGLEYFNPTNICSSKYAAITIFSDSSLTTSISTKDNTFYDTIVFRKMDNGIFKLDYVFPIKDSDYVISVLPDVKIKLYCLY